MVNPQDLESVRTYLKIHKDTIIKKYHANGVGLGKQDPMGESYVIVVYLQDNAQLPQVPILMDGIPLKFTFYLN
jgi:hypothetical protein